MQIELYAFEFYDDALGCWTLGRYRMTRVGIAAAYPRHRLLGEPEICEMEAGPSTRSRPTLFPGRRRRGTSGSKVRR